MKFIIDHVRDLVEAATHYDGAGVNRRKKVSDGGKVYIGREYSGQRGTVIFIPETETSEN